MRTRIHALILATLLLCFVSGCNSLPGRAGNGGGGMTGSGSGQKGYLAVDNKNIVFVQWTEVDKRLNGRLQIVYLKGGGRMQTESRDASFQGVTDGENVSLNFTGSIWDSPLTGKTWTGTLRGGELTLVIPLNNGILAPVKLYPATVDDYNQALAGLSKDVDAQNAQAQKERNERARIASEQQAVADGIEQVNRASSALADAVAALKDVNYDDVLKDYADHLTEMRSHYREVKDEAAKTPMSSYQLGKVRYALSRVEYDMTRVAYDGSRMKYVTDLQRGKVSRAREAGEALQSAWSNLQAAAARNSTGSPTIPFDEAGIAQRKRQAEQEVGAAIEALQAASAKAAAFEKQAKDVRDEANTFVNRIKASDN